MLEKWLAASKMAEFISNMVGNSVNQFLDGAMAVVIIMILWYCIKFFLVAPPTKEERAAKHEEDKERAGKFWGKIKEKNEESKAEQERKKKEDKISPAKKHLRKAQETSEYAMEAIRRATKKDDVKKIIGAVEDFEYHLHKSWKYLKVLRRDATTSEDKDHIHGIMEGIEAVKNNVTTKVKGKIPEFDVDWVDKIAPILGEIKTLRGSVHAVWNETMDYHKKSK
jgi:hypothetical protein